MRIGTFVVTEGTTFQAMLDQVEAAARAGLDSAYSAQVTAWDALTVLTLVGQRVPGIAWAPRSCRPIRAIRWRWPGRR